MNKDEKERVVADLAARLRDAETLIVADYRGLTMPQIDALRGRLIEHGAKFSVVKNTLTRRAAEAAGADALLALLEGPSAIAFIESDGDMVAVAKALADSARETRVLEIRGGVLQGRVISGADVEELAKLPPLDALRGQVLGVIIGPLTQLLALVNAPVQNLVGLIEARIDQLGPVADQPVADQPVADQPAADRPAADRLEGAAEGSAGAVSETAQETTSVEPVAEAEGSLDTPAEDHDNEQLADQPEVDRPEEENDGGS
jgi:large subunit ribosomal protein L10